MLARTPRLGHGHAARAGAAVKLKFMNLLVASPLLTAALDGWQDLQVAVCLLDADLLGEQCLAKARELCAATPGSHPAPLLDVLMRTGLVAARATFEALSDHYGLPLLQRAEVFHNSVDMPAACAQLALSLSWAVDQAWLLWPNPEFAESADAADLSPDALEPVPAFCIALARPLRAQARKVAKQLLAQCHTMQLYLVFPSDLQAMQEQTRQTPALRSADLMASSASGLDLVHLCELAEEGPVVELFSAMLSRAVAMRASDVHLEPNERGFNVRLRVDGAMLLLEQYAQLTYKAVVCRIKILAALDIAERRLPQDGRLQARVNGLAFDVRVPVLPSALGESVVLRLLRPERVPQQLADLGLSEPQEAQLRSWLKHSYGMVLVTGPTGSGKSTTLYTAMDLLVHSTDKIVTVEDPVEYHLPSITQIQVNADIGLGFAAALRSILRHDPDVILVGEIRDTETAKMATQAALTGHLVLSTLHTNTAAGAVTRLLDMGVEPFLLADSLRGIMAQRLVRRLCTACARPATSAEQALTPAWVRLGLERTGLTGAARIYRPVGWEQCQKTGYRDRLALYDMIDFNARMRSLVTSGVTAAPLEMGSASGGGQSCCRLHVKGSRGTLRAALSWHGIFLQHNIYFEDFT